MSYLVLTDVTTAVQLCQLPPLDAPLVLLNDAPMETIALAPSGFGLYQALIGAGGVFGRSFYTGREHILVG